jgi:hypothetical protein
MRKRVAVLIASFALSPVAAEAAACKLEHATFRPKYAPEHFEIRSRRIGDNPVFDLTIRKTNETFRFRVDVHDSTVEGTITSIPDGVSQDPGIRTGFRLLDGKGLKTVSTGEIGHLSFYDLGRAFVDFRLRGRRNPEPYASPPSGIWHVTACRPT